MSSSLAVSVQESDKLSVLSQPAEFPAGRTLLFEGKGLRSLRISRFTNREARELEERIFEVVQQLEEVLSTLTTHPAIEVEQDIWVQLPPIKEFTVALKLEYLGRAKPLPLPDELLEI